MSDLESFGDDCMCYYKKLREPISSAAYGITLKNMCRLFATGTQWLDIVDGPLVPEDFIYPDKKIPEESTMSESDSDEDFEF
jgi:hypothetical protein